jgi:hypothetical protein
VPSGREASGSHSLGSDPVGVLVLRAQHTSQGVLIRVTATLDVERSSDATPHVFTDVEPALAEVTAWLSRFHGNEPLDPLPRGLA